MCGFFIDYFLIKKYLVIESKLMKQAIILQIFLLILLAGCKEKIKDIITVPLIPEKIEKIVAIDSPRSFTDNYKMYSGKEVSQFKDSSFVLLKMIDSTFKYDMKYATDDNFLKEKVYECDDCLVRYKTAKQLINANNSFKILGYKIKFFDCYRPLSIQKKMWKIYPDKRYVANPSKGSNHNRGSAVDITLVDNLGNELEMGTGFDFFGRKAHHAYQNLPPQVLENRKLLKSVMETNGFWSITSEWWHYNLSKSYQYKVSDFKTVCED